jgi:Zn finger protein HypA/HybF involved in hydrogenase expression
MSREGKYSVNCPFCGFPFDLENLGVYGCPNCHGEGLED